MAKVRIPIAEYEAMDPQDRMRYVVDQLERELGAALKPGVGRFETLLSEIDLGGPIDDGTRRDLLEFAAVRNVIVHRAAIADRRFVELCPWLEVQPGTEVMVDQSRYLRFRQAMYQYAAGIVERAQAKAKEYEG